jgi:hypothetical protein
LKHIRRRTDILVGILNGYDNFDRSRQALADLANWMLVISMGSLAWGVCTSGFMSQTESTFMNQLFLLAIVFFWLSALLFTLFRAVLFVISGLMEKATASAQGVSQDIHAYRGSRNTREVFDSAISSLHGSIGLWWRAHRMIVQAVLAIIPAFIFYLLGLSVLMLYAVQGVAGWG